MTECKPYAEMGARIKEARLESTDFNQAQMTKKLGLEDPVYGNYERGRNKMPPHVMNAFCEITGYNSDYLLRGKGPKKREEVQREFDLYERLSKEQQARVLGFMEALIENEKGEDQ